MSKTPLYKRKENLIIKPLAAEGQFFRNWEGAYDQLTGIIYLGCKEKYVPKELSHELLHKHLHEEVNLESCIKYDSIALELDAFLFGGDVFDELPYIFTIPPKQAKSEEHKHTSLEEKGIEVDKSETVGIGITTYTSGKVNDYRSEAKKIAKVVDHELASKLKGVEFYTVEPVIGYWQGQKEPSVSVTFRGVLTPAILSQIKNFKEKYNQQAALIIRYGQKSWMGIEIHGVSEEDIPKLGLEALTYYFEENTITVLAESLDNAAIRRKVRDLGGNSRMFKVGVEFL